MPASAASAARESLTDAAAVAGSLPGRLGVDALNAARDAFSSGLHAVAAVAATAVAAVAILIVVQLRRVRPLGETDSPAAEEGDAVPADWTPAERT